MEEKPRVRPWVIALPIVLVVLAGIVWGVQRLRAPVAQALETVVPFREQRAQALAPKYTPNPPVPTPDPHAEALARLQNELAQLRAEQEQLHARLTAQQTAPTKAASTPAASPAPKPKPHRAMRHEHYDVPAKEGPGEPETFTLLPGTFLPCVLETSLNSDVGDLTFTARTTAPVYDTKTQRRLLVPQNSKLVGTGYGSDLVYGNERIRTAALTLARRGDAEGIELGEAPLGDQEGIAGLTGRVNQHFWRNVGAVFIGGALQGGTQALSMGLAGAGPAGAVSSSISQTGQQVISRETSKAIDTRPTIEVDGGSPCTVILTKALQLTAAK